VAGDTECVLCRRGTESDRGVYVWEDELWRLWTLTTGKVPGYSFLTSKRHIPYITDLDGPEAATFGNTLRRLTRTLREVTGADLVHIHVFGDGAAHFHVHLVPHHRGDALMTQVVREDAADLPGSELVAVADRIATSLGDRL
jgi:diadenosine tetraphosphate (Ap4A) HIT family hydrolase